jgi:putative transposase
VERIGRANLQVRANADYKNGGALAPALMTTYFITICAHMQQSLFQRDEVAELMVATFLKYRDAGEFELHEYVVMPNHIHLLVSIEEQQQLSRVIQLVKGGFSHSLRDHGIAFRAVWQQRYHDRRVRDANEFAEFAHYIRQNPVRKGLVENAADYPFSSARVSGLKPLEINNSALDATLKGGSTSSSDDHANEKVRSTGHVAGDVTPKVRCTGHGATNAPLPGRATINDSDLKVRSTSFSEEHVNEKVRSRSESDSKCIAIF